MGEEQGGFAPTCELLTTQTNMNLTVFNLFCATFVWGLAVVLAVFFLKSAEAQMPGLVLLMVLV